MRPGGIRQLALLRIGELIDGYLMRVSLHPLTDRRISRQAARVVRAHSVVAFDGARLVPEIVVIEVAAIVADRCPELFDRFGCAAVATLTAKRVHAAEGFWPRLTMVFERNGALKAPFRVACTRKLVRSHADAAVEATCDPESKVDSARLSTHAERELARLWALLLSYGTPQALAERSDIDSGSVVDSAAAAECISAGQGTPDPGILDHLEVARALIRSLASPRA